MIQPKIIKTDKYIEILGHYDDPILQTKLVLLSNLYSTEVKDNYVKFKVEDENKLDFINDKLDFSIATIGRLSATKWRINETPTLSPTGTYNVNFTSSDSTYSSLTVSGNQILYGNDVAYVDSEEPLTDLSNTTWGFNDTYEITDFFSNGNTFNINLYAEGSGTLGQAKSYSSISFTSVEVDEETFPQILYDSTEVFSGSWEDETERVNSSLRMIYIKDGDDCQDVNLINWLQNNSTRFDNSTYPQWLIDFVPSQSNCIYYTSDYPFEIKISNNELTPSGTIQYYLNNSWNTYTPGNNIPSTLENGVNVIYIRGQNVTTLSYPQINQPSRFFKYIRSNSTLYKIYLSGNMQYLVSEPDSQAFMMQYSNINSFQGMDIYNVTLPYSTATEQIYYYMFLNCFSLSSAPIILSSTFNEGACFRMFYCCVNLRIVPELNIQYISTRAFSQMFYGCQNLETLIELPTTSIPNQAYYRMFRGCPKIKLSETQTGEYQTPYRIPSSGTGTVGTNSLADMFTGTGGTFTGTPTVNTTYYTSNEVISASGN